MDRLIVNGLVERRESTQDRREVVIEVTTDGRRVVEDVTDRRRHAQEEIVARMALCHRQQMVAALLEFAAAADEPLVLGPPTAGGSATWLGW